MDEHGMAATDDERDVRLKIREGSHWWSALRPRRIEVCFMVMDPYEGPAQNKCQRLRRFQADHQRAGQPRPLSRCHRFNLFRLEGRLA